jgi:hypothetical protein
MTAPVQTGDSPDLGTAAYFRATEAKIAELQQKIDGLKPKKKDGWDKFQAVSSFISGLLVLCVGIFVTNRVEQAFKERQLTAQNAKDMQQVLVKLTPDSSTSDVEQSALALSVFGRYAVTPLIQVIQNHVPDHHPAALVGMRAAGATDKEAVCTELEGVLTNRTKLYSFEVHRGIAGVLGDLDCQRSLPALRAYMKSLSSASPATAPFTKALGAQELTNADFNSVKQVAITSIAALEQKSADQ